MYSTVSQKDYLYTLYVFVLFLWGYTVVIHHQGEHYCILDAEQHPRDHAISIFHGNRSIRDYY